MRINLFMEPPTDLREVIESEIKYERTVVSARILRHVNLCLENGIFVSFDRIFFSLLMYRLSVDIYFHQRNADEHHAALQLRDAVLRLRYNGAFIAVPLFRVNTEPVGPHPVGSSIFFSGKEHSSQIFCQGSYEIWVPAESFGSVFSYLCLNRGNLRSFEIAQCPF
jgi:aromatic ring-cleaving dioxygenase